jgi:dienelactone hydrolase
MKYAGFLSLLLACAACVADTSDFDDQGATTTAGSVTTTSSGGGSAAGGGGSGGVGGAGVGGGGGQASIYDPNMDGPFGILEIDETVTVPATGSSVAIHCAYPATADGAPYPIVLVGHGFNLPPTQYYGYVRRLATFGYVAMTVDFNAGFTGVDHVANANELLGGIDWAAGHASLGAVADSTRVGTTGHSLGGKVALLAATLDDRVKASITLDPVDGGMSCSPAQCPDVSALLPIGIPTGFIGETLDASGAFQACAPAAQNFETFYANAAAPSLSVEVLGANHMSFLDDVSSCGFTCSFCNTATLANDTVTALSRAMVVAFYERHLKGDVGYDTYLSGDEAQARYVGTGTATIAVK